MNRSDFIEKIKGTKEKGSEYIFNMDFPENPSKEDIDDYIRNIFPFKLNKEQLSFFKSEPDWGFMEDNEEDYDYWRYTSKVDLNEIYDILIKEKKDVNIVKIYRIENKEEKGIYSVGLGYTFLKPGESPHKDGDISLVFRENVTDYMRKWQFAFKNKDQIEMWLDFEDKEKLLSMKSKGLNLVEIKIDRQKIVEGNEQVIFKPTDVLEKKIIEMKLIENKKGRKFLPF